MCSSLKQQMNNFLHFHSMNSMTFEELEMYFPLDFGHRSMVVFQNLLIGLADCCLYCLQKQRPNWTEIKTFLSVPQDCAPFRTEFRMHFKFQFRFWFRIWANKQEAEFKIHISI